MQYQLPLKLAQEGVNIVVAAKSVIENEKLGGTILSLTKEADV